MTKKLANTDHLPDTVNPTDAQVNGPSVAVIGTPAVEEQPMSVQAQADAEFDELRQAAEAGTKALNKEITSGELQPSAAKNDEAVELTPEQIEERRKWFAEKARIQRERGKEELSRAYTNVVVLTIPLKVNNVSIGSVATRFLGLIDRSLFVIHKVSSRLIGSSQTNQLEEQISRMITKYTDDAKEELAKAKTLYEVEKAKFQTENFDSSLPWMEPAYNSAAIDLIVHLKHKDSYRMVRGMSDYDEAIRLVTVLSWNGSVEESHIEQITSRQKQLAKQVFVVCIRAVNGLYNKSKPKAAAQMEALPLAA